MIRSFLVCIVFLLETWSALAEAPVYWLEFYGGLPLTQNGIDHRFQQLQDDYHISAVINIQVVKAQSSGMKTNWAPHQVMVFQGQQRNFDRYFASAKYKELNEIRLSEIETVTTMMATELRADGIKFLEMAPMNIWVLSSEPFETSEPSLSLDITKVIELKGSPSRSAPSIKQVQILPLSFDDNPMDFMPVGKSAARLWLIGETMGNGTN